MFLWRKLLLALAWAGIVVIPPAAQAAITDGGFVAAVGCSTQSCVASTTLELESTGFVPVAGSILLDPGNQKLDFTITLTSILSLSAVGSDDNGVASLEFLSATYSASGLDLIDTLGLGTDFVIAGGQLATVTASQVQRNDAGEEVTPEPDFGGDVRVTGVCLKGAAHITCGMTFGTTQFVFDVGSGEEAPQTPRYFRQTLNVTTIPEPDTLALVIVGLALLGGSRRREALRRAPRSRSGTAQREA